MIKTSTTRTALTGNRDHLAAGSRPTPADRRPDLTGYRLVHRAMTVDLEPLLRRAIHLSRTADGAPELAHTLHQIADLLSRHITDEEAVLFPVVEARMTVDRGVADRPRDHERQEAHLQVGPEASLQRSVVLARNGARCSAKRRGRCGPSSPSSSPASAGARSACFESAAGCRGATGPWSG